jgi:ADP-ribose pyrophosphatase YjhB (NUDIX family)
MKDGTLLTSIAVLFNKKSSELKWFLVREREDSDWEIPKSVARTGESSVRAVIRAMGEQAGMRVKVLEEIGRHGGAAKVNGKIVTQRTIYYLMSCKEGNEILEYVESGWFDHAAALRKLKSKRDKEMLKSAKVLLKEIREKRKKKKEAEALASA